MVGVGIPRLHFDVHLPEPLGTEIPALEAEEKKASKELENALARIPNLPLDEVPEGKESSDNVDGRHRS